MLSIDMCPWKNDAPLSTSDEQNRRYYTYDASMTLVCPSQGGNLDLVRSEHAPPCSRNPIRTITVSKKKVTVIHNHSLIYHFFSLSHSRPHPHPAINFVTVPLIPRLHFHEESKSISIGINIIRSRWIS